MTLQRFDDLPDVRVTGESLRRPILWVGLQWAVTAHRIQARNGTYSIAADRVWEDDDGWGWSDRMAEKNWVDLDDLNAALSVARQRWPKSSK